jgi:hypothetical protein
MEYIDFSAIGLFAGSITLMISSNLVLYAIVGEVNRKLPEDQQFKYLFWYPAKFGKVKKEYRRLYPKSRLALMFNVCVGVSALLMLACVWRLGFFK